MRKAQHQRPAVRFAQRVTAMTPLFCAKSERGATVKRAEKPAEPVAQHTALNPRVKLFAVDRDAGHLCGRGHVPDSFHRERDYAGVSGQHGYVWRDLLYTASIGRMAGGYTRILNVLTHRKVIAGAVEMVEPSIYPAAPATMQPTARPTMMEVFLRKGEPKSSVRMIETKDRKPRPII